MRRLLLNMVLPCLVVVSAIAATGGETNEQLPMAFGCLDKLKPGDAFVYRLKVPKHGLWGSIGSAAYDYVPMLPRRPEDYETMLLRLGVVSALVGPNDAAVVMRVQQVDEEDRPAQDGPCLMELKVAGGELHAKLRWHQFEVGREGWAGVFLNYPPVKAAPERRGQKLFVFPYMDRDLPGYQITVGQDGVSITVEARYYVVLPRVESEEEIAKEKWTEYFDAEANDVVAQPKEGRRLLPVKLQEREIQQWDAGQPFWKRMTRWTADGILIRSCELVKQTKVPLEELGPPPQAQPEPAPRAAPQATAPMGPPPPEARAAMEAARENARKAVEEARKNAAEAAQEAQAPPAQPAPAPH